MAQVLREKFPEKALLIAGDDDRRTPGRNPGREQATKAAEAVNAHLVMPTFASGEQARDPKRFSDFCDVKVHSRLGLDGLKEQIDAALDAALPAPEQTRVAAQVRSPEHQTAKPRARAGRGDTGR